MNGYFQLVCKESETIVRVIAPSQEGVPVSANEIAQYLADRNILYDKNVLYNAVNKAEDCDVTVNQGYVPEVREGYTLSISPDKMSAVARFYAPSIYGEKLSEAEFLKDLSYKGITTGICTDEIRRFFAQRHYCEDIIVALGMPVTQGQDSRIEYYFNTDLKLKPEVKEDGSVDFFNLKTINHCKKGQVIACLIAEVQGEDGLSIFGETIRPREVKKQVLKYGRNISVSEDKLQMISEVDGHVMLVEGKVFVSDVFVVEEVGTSTGNIDYEGSVQVNGNVCANFSVKSRGNIIVSGIVEGAYLEAGGDIILARGINGMNRGTLKAGGNVIAKFVENTTVMATGCVTAESIIHSTVQSCDEISVNGRRGYITGGVVSAVNRVNAKVLGSTMGADTVVEVGVDPFKKQKILELQKQIGEANKVVRSVQPQLAVTQEKLAKGVKLTPDQIHYMKSLITLSQSKQAQIQNCTQEMEQLQGEMVKAVKAQVVVTGEVYPGTRVCIGENSLSVQSEIKYCRFILAEGEVKMTAI